MVEKSILTSTKKILGVDKDYTAFDLDIMTHINSSLSTLTQLGVGPEEGFMIEDDTATWDQLLVDQNKLNPVKTYVYLRTRLLFDPPTTSFVLTSMQEQVKELEWRLNVAADTKKKTSSGVYGTDDVYVWEISENEPFPEEAELGDVGFDPVTGNVWRKV